MKDDFIMPILVLALICLVVSGALAATNVVTEPVITSAAEARAETARYEMLPESTGFERIEADGLPDTVREVYRSENGVGFVLIMVTKGYGGDIRIICGMDNDGRVTKSSTLAHNETKGLGSKITELPFESQFAGADSRLSGVSAITGATISTEAYISAIGDAFAAFEIVRGVR